MTLSAFIDRSRTETENWKYTNLSALLTALPVSLVTNAKSTVPAASDHARFVFIDGVWQSKQSTFGSIPSCIFMGDLESGYKLTLGEHTCLVAQPIEFVFASSEKAPREVALKLSIDVGDNGRLTLLETYLTSPSLVTLDADITLHRRAKFVHGKIVHGGVHLATTKVQVASGGYYNNFSLLRGVHPARNEIDVSLNGEEAQAALNGMMLLRHSEHADTTTRITHQAPHCASRQIYKTILDGKARGVFQGKIIVAQDAQKTDGYQLSRALLLSDQAEMDAKPELEIYADDVKCSHGSTIGDLDENALFYLRARGLSETEARALLIQSFVTEMLDEIQVEDWREVFRREIEGWAL